MGLMPGGVSYDQKVLGYGPIAYWPLWELSGTTAQCLVNPAQNGTYSGVTLGQEGIGDGGQAPLFDGANDYVDIYSAALAAIFPYDEGSFCGWMKVFNVGVWSDGAVRIFISAAAALGGAAFMVNFYRRGVVNNVTYFRDDGADNQVLQHVVVAPVTDWQHFALTWSVTSLTSPTAMRQGRSITPRPTGIAPKDSGRRLAQWFAAMSRPARWRCSAPVIRCM